MFPSWNQLRQILFLANTKNLLLQSSLTTKKNTKSTKSWTLAFVDADEINISSTMSSGLDMINQIGSLLFILNMLLLLFVASTTYTLINLALWIHSRNLRVQKMVNDLSIFCGPLLESLRRPAAQIFELSADPIATKKPKGYTYMPFPVGFNDDLMPFDIAPTERPSATRSRYNFRSRTSQSHRSSTYERGATVTNPSCSSHVTPSHVTNQTQTYDLRSTTRSHVSRESRDYANSRPGPMPPFAPYVHAELLSWGPRSYQALVTLDHPPWTPIPITRVITFPNHSWYDQHVPTSPQELETIGRLHEIQSSPLVVIDVIPRRNSESLRSDQ